MKIYNTKTQSDYDALMIELEKQWCKWAYGEKPTVVNLWFMYKETTCLKVDNYIILHSSLDYYKEKYPNENIIEYKSNKKGETDDFIKELTVKIYYNEITKKHYNSYDEAINDCKKEMEKLHDKN